MLGKTRRAEDGRTAAGMRALSELAARNGPVSVVRRDLAEEMPHARGRVLGMDGESISLDRVQVIGREAEVKSGHELEVYFSFSESLYHFRSEVLAASQPVRVNSHLVVQGMRIGLPQEISDGQRRQAFRVSFVHAEDQINGELWLRRSGELSPEWADELGDGSADFCVRVVNASERGLGVLVEGVSYSRFAIFDRAIVRFKEPVSGELLRCMCEVRQSLDLKERGARLGLSVLRFGSADEERALRTALSSWQRDELRRRRGVA